MFRFCCFSLANLWTAKTLKKVKTYQMQHFLVSRTLSSWWVREDLYVFYWTAFIPLLLLCLTTNTPSCIQTRNWAAESFFPAPLSCQSLRVRSAISLRSCFNSRSSVVTQKSFSSVSDPSIWIWTKSMSLTTQSCWVGGLCATVPGLWIPDTSGLRNVFRCNDT